MADIVGGSIVWNLDVDDSKFKSKMAGAAAEAKTFSNTLDGSVASSITRFGNRISTAGDKAEKASRVIGRPLFKTTVVAGAALGILGKSAFDMARQVENARLNLTTFTGSASKAGKVTKELIDFATSDKGVLFQRADLLNSAQNLALFGVKTEDLTGNVKIMSKAVALGKKTFADLDQVLGRVLSTGKLSGIEFDELTKAGIKMPKSLRNATVSAKELFKAIDKGVSSKVLSDRVNTIDGTMIRFKSAIQIAGASMLGLDRATGKFAKGSAGEAILNLFKDLSETLKSKETQESLKKIGEALADFASDAAPKIKDFINFVARNIDTIIAGFKIWVKVWLGLKVASLVLKPLGTMIKGIGKAVKVTSALVNSNFAKMVARGAVWVAKSTAQVAKVVARYGAGAIKIAAKWALAFGKMVARTLWAAPKMIAKAADVGLAWVINAVRVAFVWTTQTLPKILMGMARTVPKATVYAAKTGLSWIVAATKSALAWTVTSLPKIIAKFLLVSAKAAVHALKTSAAWVLSASKSAIVWTVTAMPRIIAAFVKIAVAAAVNGGKTAAAWALASAKSTASFKALSLLIGTPLVMPALVITAALASIATVIAAYNSMKAAIEARESATASAEGAGKANDIAIKAIKNSKHYSPSQKAARIQNLTQSGGKFGNTPGRASGGPVRKGSPYIVGEKRPELFVPNQSGKIVPNLNDVGGGTVINNNIQNVNIGSNAKGMHLMQMLTRQDEITAKGLR